MPPELWLLVGGNGSGKSTFYETFLARKHIPLINADNIARTLWPDQPERHSYEAALLAEKERFRLLDERQTFCFESVFSHPSKLDFVGAAKAAGYVIKVFYFHLSSVDLNIARVACRVTAGGHSVPDDKVRGRIPRTLNLIRDAAGLANELHLIDNSSADQPYQRLAVWREGQWTLLVEHPPAWVITFTG
ncbi:AAA family ATPase [Marinobacter caseinilyticus]|uniref:AAA family ATPase n=1 Tax=Marinobacter caseinilyticus TaxID=2692195 RepID=UPI0014079582|nr:AAA family ATPase [Marinobacter caseinilyticus]